MTEPARPPFRATYRLQLHRDFGFAAAEAVVPYLRDLGVSHLYLSPSLTARAGSMHGYDVVDPTRVSDELGGEDGLRSLAAASHGAGLGIVLDIVPNHLAVDDSNRWWSDLDQRAKVFDWDPDTGWYRRFFDVDELAGVRVEDPEVFDLTHRKVLELVADGVVDGLRIDHPDGLVDPAGYLERLADRCPPGTPIWVEKILEPGERLRPWPVAGTVGYEHLTLATSLFVDPAGEEPITDLWHELSGDDRPYPAYVADGKREQATGTFDREVERLAELAPWCPKDAIVDALVRFPTYRAYVVPDTGAVTDEDREVVAEAGIRDRLASVLLLDERTEHGDELVTRFQQLCGPVMAKGVEDTAFYRYHRLLALNEVGGDPGRFSASVDDLHAANRERLANFPREMVGATTHDTKRSLDTRSRLAVLAGLVGRGEGDGVIEHVRRWLELTADLVEDGAPDDAERWLVLQTLIGTWPITTDRLDAYLTKALREAKVHTNWIDPDESWERRVLAYATGLLTHPGFLADFEPFVEERVVPAAEQASLGQVLLRATVPGVCDTYQDDEEWFLALVDPDNRRPIDWAAREVTLEALRGGAAPTQATAKTHVLHRALQLRARRPAVFGPEAEGGGYHPVDAGPDVAAYRRGADGGVLVVVPLRPAGLDATVEVPPAPGGGAWTDELGVPPRTVPEGPVRVGDLVDPQVSLGLFSG